MIDPPCLVFDHTCDDCMLPCNHLDPPEQNELYDLKVIYKGVTTMIATANLELSKRLQELAPGWNDTTYCWARRRNHHPAWVVAEWHDARVAEIGELVIAPDLDWLLNKMRHAGVSVSISCSNRGYKATSYVPALCRVKSVEYACDAACALLIKLLEQKVTSV